MSANISRLLLGLIIVVITIYLIFFTGGLKTVSFEHADGSESVFSVEIADNIIERARGLSFREEVPDGTGMLFIFRTSGKHGFWFKDTLVPLDILWLDSNYMIVYIKRDGQPESYPEVFYPTSEAMYVLEVASGQARQIFVGDYARVSQ